MVRQFAQHTDDSTVDFSVFAQYTGGFTVDFLVFARYTDGSKPAQCSLNILVVLENLVFAQYTGDFTLLRIRWMFESTALVRETLNNTAGKDQGRVQQTLVELVFCSLKTKIGRL